MRKVCILMLYLIPVLLVWGQDGTAFNLDSIRQAVAELKQLQPGVIASADKARKISNEDKMIADSILNKTFESLDSVLNVYNYIKNDSLLANNAQRISYNFIVEYKKAILSDNGSKIQIASRGFLDVAEAYVTQFDEFYKNAQKYIEDHSVQAPPADSPVVTPKSSSENGEPEIPMWYWFVMCVGILGFALAVFTVFAIIKVNTCVNHRANEIKKLEGQISKLSQQLSEIKLTSFRGTTQTHQSQVNQVVRCQPKQQLRREDPVIETQPRNDEAKSKTVVEQKSTITNLYATIKANSPLAEFFKVSAENSRDKVFMLILANPDANVADFTIVPNMASDFMRSVINDRDTYLPAIFCEKSIESQNPSKIVVLSQGKAKKVDGKWQVQERMSIKLV